MNYRPIVDAWILARPRLKNGEHYYGSFPLGFPERARRLLGVSLDDAVLHVCAGKVRKYPYDGAIGPNDKTMDLDASTYPDYCADVRKLNQWPMCYASLDGGNASTNIVHGWPAMLIDPPYTEEDARHYLPGLDQFPRLSLIIRNAAERLRVGGRMGILHYLWASPPKKLTSDGCALREIAVVFVSTGRNQRPRHYVVLEKFRPRPHVPEVEHPPEPAQQPLDSRAHPGDGDGALAELTRTIEVDA